MRLLRLLAAALVAAFLAVLVAGPAWAHNSLTKAVPDRDARLGQAPDGIELTFLQRVDPEALTIRVTDAGQREVPAGPAEADGRTGAITFTTPPANGTYTVTYRVVSLDGHPVEGSYRFTVDDPAAARAPSPAGSAPSPAGPAPSPAAPASSLAAPASSLAAPASSLGAPAEAAASAVATGPRAVPLADAADDSRPWSLAAAAAVLAALGLVAFLVLRRRRT